MWKSQTRWLTPPSQISNRTREHLVRGRKKTFPLWNPRPISLLSDHRYTRRPRVEKFGCARAPQIVHIYGKKTPPCLSLHQRNILHIRSLSLPPFSSPSFKIFSPQREIKTLFMYFDAETWAAECRNNSAGVFSPHMHARYVCRGQGNCRAGNVRWSLQSQTRMAGHVSFKKNNSPLKPSIQNMYPNSYPAYDSASPLRNDKNYFERVARQRGMIRSTTSSVHKHPALRFSIQTS